MTAVAVKDRDSVKDVAILECRGSDVNPVANFVFLRVAKKNWFCDFAKSQKSFATTLFLRLEPQNMIVQRNRLPIGYMSSNFRAYGLNVLEVKELESIDIHLEAGLLTIAVLSATAKNRRRHKKHIEKLKRFCAAVAALRLSKTIFYTPKVLGPKRERRTIFSFSSRECWRRFRFRRRDLPRLLRVLGLENFEVQIGKHGTFHGEEILLYSLNRLTTCTSHADLMSTYDTDESNLCAMYNFFLSYVYTRFGYLLKNKGQFNLGGLMQTQGPICSVPPGEDMAS